MSDLNEFNNNNYMPGFYGEMNSIAHQNLATTFNLRGNSLPQPFTFTSPNHGSTLSSPRPNTQASQLGNMSAPGVGTTWQHSVPTTMPWSNNNLASSLNHQAMSPFEDPIHPFTGYHHAMLEPQPSCSSPMKRPKRKALEYSEDAPMSKVYLCAHQFASLQISPEKESDADRQVRHISYNSHPNSGRKGREDSVGWERFREVENSIDYDSEEDSVKAKAANENKGIICFDEKLIQDTATSSSSSSSPILPQKVLDDITKPCLQVVLWKSPGEIMRDIVKEDSQSLMHPSSLTNPSSDSSASSLTNNSSQGQMWLSSSSSSINTPPSYSFMMEEELPMLSNAAKPGQAPSPTNSCLLSSPSPSNLNWLTSSASNPLNLAASPNQGGVALRFPWQPGHSC